MKKKKHIYIAYTGGTIGMQPSQQGFIPVRGYMATLLEQHADFHHEQMPDFTLHEYDPLIDSADMKPSDWQRIADDIHANYHKYDGFVILHGTDTMAYTASALSFMFENLGKPIIITGSQIPLSQLRSDGQPNLVNALYLAAHYPICEVSLYFNNQLLRGNRTTKTHADSFNAFTSPNYPPLLKVGIGIEMATGVISPPPQAQYRRFSLSHQPIGVVSLYPGISADVIENILFQPVNALILSTFGTGNAPQNPELLAALAQAAEREVLIVNLTQCTYGKVNMHNYATGNALANAGVISGYDMTCEAALAKLHFLLSQEMTYEQRRFYMGEVLRGEMTL